MADSLDRDLGIHPGYKELVEDAYKHNNGFDIPNSTLGHAIFLSELLIKKAKKKISIFTREPNEIFYKNKDICDAIEFARSKNVNVEIILENFDYVENKNFLEFANKNKLEIKRVSKETKVDIHFLLIDNSSYRVEWPHSPKDFKEDYKVKSVANFKDNKGASILENVFRNLLENSERLEYPIDCIARS